MAKFISIDGVETRRQIDKAAGKKESMKALCKEKGLKFDRVNENLPERIRAFKGDCRKISADVYIDDRAVKFKFGKKLDMGGDTDAGKDE